MNRTPPHLGTLILLTGLTVLTLNMFLPALPGMTRDLETTQARMAWAVSGYMLAAAVFQIVLGPVSDRMGRRPVLLASMVLYLVASLGCVLAQDATLFLIFRMTQGVVVAGSVLSSAVIRDVLPPEKAAARLGTVSAAMALAPMIGPVLGGLLDAAFGWRAVFGLYSGLGAVALWLVWIDLGETRQTGQAGTSRSDYKVLLGSGRFWAFSLCMTFAVGAFYIFLAGAPFVAEQRFGLSSAQVGIGLGSITAGFMAGATVTARCVARFGLIRLILAGRLVALAGVCLGLALFLGGATHPVALFGTTIFVGFGNGLTMANAYSGAMSVVPALAGSAAGLSGALLVLGGAGLTWLTLAALGQEASAVALLTIMAASIFLSLVFALLALRPAAGDR